MIPNMRDHTLSLAAQCLGREELVSRHHALLPTHCTAGKKVLYRGDVVTQIWLLECWRKMTRARAFPPVRRP